MCASVDDPLLNLLLEGQVPELAGWLRKMDGEKERFEWCGDFWAEVGEM